MINLKKYKPSEVTKEEWARAKCDKWDYMVATCCGSIAGLMDIFLVNIPEKSKLEGVTDNVADNLVIKFAKMCGWESKSDSKKMLSSAVRYLEHKFQINYDQTSTKSVDGQFNMNTKNHHYKSLAHSPSLVGLFFSVVDQFTNSASFLSDGKLIRIDTSDNKFKLKGGNFAAKLFCAFCNWFGHIISDLSGCSSTKGRGAGVVIPFMELFQCCDFGELQTKSGKQTLAITMTKVFEEGYDLRFGAAMATPLLLEELIIKVYWVVRQRFQKRKKWSECRPSKQHADLRIMLLIGNSALCLLDGVGAVITTNGNAVAFILNLNYIAWIRLVMLVIREASIRFEPIIREQLQKFEEAVLYTVTPAEQKVIQEFYERMQQIDTSLEKLYQEFAIQIIQKYQVIYDEIEQSFSDKNSSNEQADHSIKVAEACGVEKSRIIHNNDELDKIFKQ